MIKKLIIYSVLVFLTYQGISLYMAYRVMQQVASCGDPAVFDAMEKNNTPTLERLQYAAKGWACVKAQQTVFDAMYFKIQDSWLHPEIWLQEHSNDKTR